MFDQDQEFQETIALIELGAKAQHEIEEREKVSRIERFMRERLEPIYAGQIKAQVKSGNRTRSIYKTTFKGFAAFCAYLEIPPLPSTPGIVAGYLQSLLDEEGADVARLRREAAAIAYAHRSLEHLDPTEDLLVAAIIRTQSEGERRPHGRRTH